MKSASCMPAASRQPSACIMKASLFLVLALLASLRIEAKTKKHPSPAITAAVSSLQPNNQTKQEVKEQYKRLIKKMFGRQILTLAASALSFGALVEAQTSLIPDGSVDIGTVGFPGSSTPNGDGNWLVTGSGSDIWSSYDHFHYMYFNSTTSDTTVTVRVNSWGGTSTNSWRKGGIMFRSHLGQRAAHSMIQLTGWGIAHQSRACENCGSTSEHDSYDVENVWLRLVKEGNLITSYVKKDGEYDFMRYQSDEVDLGSGSEFMVGIAVTSHDNAATSTLDVSGFEISDEVFSLPLEVHEVGETGELVWIQEYAPSMWSLKAAGTDIGGTADSFGFFDQEATGDIIADLHFEKLHKRNMNSKGGLMIRASHAVDAPHVSLLVTAKDGVTLFHRSTAGGDTTSKNVGVWQEDVELRMEKTGNSVKCMYKHESGAEWYVLGTVTAELDSAGTYLVGQAVTSADHGDHATLKTGSLVVTPVTA